jgi:hypothetical protein
MQINRGTKIPPKRVHLVNASSYASADTYAHARVHGCGNPMTTGSTRGPRVIVSTRNISKFTVAGTAHLVGTK